MTLLETLFAQTARAMREPREAAADIIALDVPREAVVPAFALMSLISVILLLLSEAVAPTVLSLWSPFQLTALFLLLYGGLAFTTCRIGRMMDGIGTCPDALLLITLMLAVFVPIKVVHTVFLVVSLPLAGLLSIFLFFYSIWINVMLVAALHGYENLGKAVAVSVLSWIAVGILLAFLGPLLGINMTDMVPNV